MNMRILKSTATQEFPFVESFIDYHFISPRQTDLAMAYNDDGNNIKIAGKEIGCDGQYWGLFWIVGEMPNKAEVQELMDAAGAGDLL